MLNLKDYIGEATAYDKKRRYRATQIKAAVAVNSALIEFYWNLGKDIAEKFAEEARYGSRFFEKVSFDMKAEFPSDSGFSPRNIRYCQDFYCLYSAASILQQLVAKSAKGKQTASFDLETSDILAGEMDKDDIDRVRGWMSIHREELFANWKLLGEEGTYFKIEPLR